MSLKCDEWGCVAVKKPLKKTWNILVRMCCVTEHTVLWEKWGELLHYTYVLYIYIYM